MRTVESGEKMAAFPRSQTTGYSDMRVSIRWGYNPNLFRLWKINLNDQCNEIESDPLAFRIGYPNPLKP